MVVTPAPPEGEGEGEIELLVVILTESEADKLGEGLIDGDAPVEPLCDKETDVEGLSDTLIELGEMLALGEIEREVEAEGDTLLEGD